MVVEVVLSALAQQHPLHQILVIFGIVLIMQERSSIMMKIPLDMEQMHNGSMPHQVMVDLAQVVQELASVLILPLLPTMETFGSV